MDRRYALPLLLPLSLAGVGTAVLVLAVSIFIGSSGFGYDYAAYDAAARRLAAGAPVFLADTPELYASGAYEGLFLYPPAVATWFMPFTVLPAHVATLAWLAARLVLLCLACAVLPVRPAVRLSTFGVACVSFPVLFDLNIGNVSIVVFVLTAIAWRTAGTRLAALPSAMLVALRAPFAIFFLAWVVQGNARMILLTILAGLALIALSLPIVGASAYVDYLTILGSLPDISTGPHNVSLRSASVFLGASDQLGWAAQIVGYGVGIVAVVLATRRGDQGLMLAVAATATLVVSPFIHPHYLVILLIPAALLADRGHRWGLVLPLLGWLPHPLLPLIGPATLALLLWAPTKALRGTHP